MSTLESPPPVVNPPPQKILLPTEDGQVELRVFPLRPKGKEPYEGRAWWYLQRRAPTKRELSTWLHEYPDANYAVVGGQPIGKHFLSILDCDTPEQIRWVVRNVGACFSVRTARGFHYYVLTKTRLPSGHAGPGVRVTGHGQYVVAPGSFHPTGVRYEAFQLSPPAVVSETLLFPHIKRGERARTSNNEWANEDPPIVWDHIPQYRTRSELEHGITCRLIRKRWKNSTIVKWFERNLDAVPKFAEMLGKKARAAYAYLLETIGEARSYLSAHDHFREEFLSLLPKILAGVTRQAIVDLWGALLSLFKKFGRLYKGGIIAVKAAKCLLTDTAYRSFDALCEVLKEYGITMWKIASAPLQQGHKRTGSTYLLQIPESLITPPAPEASPPTEKKKSQEGEVSMPYGEVASEAAPEAVSVGEVAYDDRDPTAGGPGIPLPRLVPCIPPW